MFKKNQDTEYLLLKNRGKWGFLKGMKEGNESAEEAALREAREETGIEKLKLVEGFSQDSKIFYRWEGELVNKHITLFLFEALSSEVKISFEHEDFKWATIDEALNLLKIKDYKETLIKAHKFLQDLKSKI